ncbi:MAG: Fic family protein [Candidatus Fibromonas sp.]|jgi:fido (protein-threonine AMPylation protein)|nr:Fic family protein [Candidatus Fibromonas sp.]
MSEYFAQSEPEDCKKRSYNWKTAIGLQAVDGLVPSKYLLDIANLNIKGELPLDEIQQKLQSYYESKPAKTTGEERQKEADLVSLRITKLLSSDAFDLSCIQLLSIHKNLFEGIYDFAGKCRTCNISKKEWVLGGLSVIYGDFEQLRETIEYDINQEKNFSYANLDEKGIIEHFSKFIANFWQIHPFGEGNTRTVAVFAIKYLRTLGFEITNEPFESNSLYFRNALVRANYQNLSKKVYATTRYLEIFFENALLGAKNELKNRELNITGAK